MSNTASITCCNMLKFLCSNEKKRYQVINKKREKGTGKKRKGTVPWSEPVDETIE